MKKVAAKDLPPKVKQALDEVGVDDFDLDTLAEALSNEGFTLVIKGAKQEYEIDASENPDYDARKDDDSLTEDWEDRRDRMTDPEYDE